MPNLCSDEIERLELKLNYKKPVLLCAIYRPPNVLAQYMETLTTHLEQGINLGRSTIIIGDLNIDISIKHNSLNDICTYLNLTHLITEPTRVTSTSSSVIDHIMTTCPDLHSRSDIPGQNLFYIGRKPPRRTRLEAFKDYTNTMVWEWMSAHQATPWSYKFRTPISQLYDVIASRSHDSIHSAIYRLM